MASFLLVLLSVALVVCANDEYFESKDHFQQPPPVAPQFERIITDIRDVMTGINIDYSYNDTAPPYSEGLPSVPGCPKNDNGQPWVYYRATSIATSNKCYLVGERGPCELGQKIFMERGSPFGYCNCDCFEGFQRNSTSREAFCSPLGWNTKFVFYSDVKKCHALFDQGPCKENEWLVELDENEKRYISSDSVTKCEPRKCPVGQLYEAKFQAGYGCGLPRQLLATVAGAFTAGPNSCKEDETFSTLLKKCVKKAPMFPF